MTVLMLHRMDIAPVVLLTKNHRATLFLVSGEMSHMMDFNRHYILDQITTHVEADKWRFNLRFFCSEAGNVLCQWDMVRRTSDPFDGYNS